MQFKGVKDDTQILDLAFANKSVQMQGYIKLSVLLGAGRASLNLLDPKSKIMHTAIFVSNVENLTCYV